MRQKNSIPQTLLLIWQFLAFSSYSHGLEEHQTKGEKSALQLFGIFHIEAYETTKKQSGPMSHC